MPTHYKKRDTRVGYLFINVLLANFHSSVVLMRTYCRLIHLSPSFIIYDSCAELLRKKSALETHNNIQKTIEMKRSRYTFPYTTNVKGEIVPAYVMKTIDTGRFTRGKNRYPFQRRLAGAPEPEWMVLKKPLRMKW